MRALDDDPRSALRGEREVLTYAPAPPGVSRRAFRALLALTLLNTALLAGYVMGPGLYRFGGELWAARQERLAEEAKQVARAAQQAAAAQAAATRRVAAMEAERAALAFARPADELVYNDNPRSYALAEPLAPGTTTTVAEVWPGVAPQPAEYVALSTAASGSLLRVFNPDHVVLFMHERRATPDCDARLVVVIAERPRRPNELERYLAAYALQPTTPAADLKLLDHIKYRWRPTDLMLAGRSREGWDHMRFLSGVPDPTDEARFEIRYDIGEASNVIIGTLGHDDRVRLQPAGVLGRSWWLSSSSGRQ